jgi:hypothetical protein
LGFFFSLGWIFVLGILVGRGFLPEGVKAMSELKAQIAKLQNMISDRDSSDLEFPGKFEKDPKFSFYSELADMKEEAARKRPPDVKKKIKNKGKQKQNKPLITGRKYTVQLASLGSEKKADSLVNRLKDRGYPAYSYRVDMKGNPFYRVRCGRLESEKEALALKEALAKHERLEGYVTRVEE